MANWRITRWLALATVLGLSAPGAAFVTSRARAHTMRVPSTMRPPVLCSDASASSSSGKEPAPEATGEDAPQRPWYKRILQRPKFDRASLTKLGSSMVLSYGFVSNMNAGFLIIISWATFRRANPLLSPLTAGTALGPLVIPGLSAKFLLVYGGYYATVGNLLRPVRIALAGLLAPAFTRAIKVLKERFGLPQAGAIGLVVFVANFLGTWALILVGVRLACIIAGVPVFPPAAA
mmetsp:Transcript_1547/g.4370  ORF Transcript_1547/g.4370 Transcript_1547/m.4370 type:complete len:234 (-) Transcript_1547:210-911(-)